MRLSGLGAFPSVKKARVIWAGVEADIAALRKMTASIDDFSAGYKIAKERRPFSAHITLARLREPSMINLNTTVQEIAFTIDYLHLYRSELTPKGAIYTLLHSSPFTGRPGG
jgi:RNA 2',3'-cyclic 3'-phosphodiesterase